jgi:hypothetical protein
MMINRVCLKWWEHPKIKWEMVTISSPITNMGIKNNSFSDIPIWKLNNNPNISGKKHLMMTMIIIVIIIIILPAYGIMPLPICDHLFWDRRSRVQPSSLVTSSTKPACISKADACGPPNQRFHSHGGTPLSLDGYWKFLSTWTMTGGTQKMGFLMGFFCSFRGSAWCPAEQWIQWWLATPAEPAGSSSRQLSKQLADTKTQLYNNKIKIQ